MQKKFPRFGKILQKTSKVRKFSRENFQGLEESFSLMKTRHTTIVMLICLGGVLISTAWGSAPPKTRASEKPGGWTRLGTWSEADGPSVSRLGREVLKADRKSWVHGESEHFIYHTQSPGDMEGLADEVEYAYRKSASYLGPVSPKRKGHVFLVSPKTWTGVIRKADRRRDSLAMQVRNDIFILKSSNEAANVVRIPHELVHYRLWQEYGRKVPVWLDEGLAGCLGWRMAESYKRKSGRQLIRKIPAVKKNDLLTLEELTGMSEYPGGPGKAPAFYRQSEELIRGIARKIGYDKLAEFVKAVAGDGRDWRVFLRERFSYSDHDFEWLEGEIVSEVRGQKSGVR